MYRRGSLVEWYANGPLGLEQGFTLASPPTADRLGLLTLALGLSGNAVPTLASDGKGLRFVDSTLRYDDLAASDARGHSLRAWLELRGRRLLIRVDDADARYPLTIDPLVQLAKLTASDGGADVEPALGWSVAVSGDTIVAGAPDADGVKGAAYVFVEPASGWANATEKAKLTGSDRNDYGPGFSVAISGDTIVSGAPTALSDRGAVYVFVKPAGGWRSSTETAKLTVPDSGSLGYSVAISGDTIVAGAPHTVDRYGYGAAYVFVRPAAGWTSGAQAAKLTPSDLYNDPDEVGVFGSSVAVSGDTIVAGAPGKLIIRGDLKYPGGEAYVFVRLASGWASGTETARLFDSDGALNFGTAVAVSGDTIAATVPATGPMATAGIYVFEKPASGWNSGTETARLITSDGKETGTVPMTLALSGNTILTSGVFPENDTGRDAVYVFVKPAAGWASGSETTKLPDPQGAGLDGSFFGSSVAVSGQTIAIGAAQASVNHHRQGAVYLFGPGSPSTDKCHVPLVKGKRLTVARKRITAAHCSVGRIRYARSKKKRRGVVLNQSPRAGTVLSEKGRVSLVVSRGRR